LLRYISAYVQERDWARLRGLLVRSRQFLLLTTGSLLVIGGIGMLLPQLVGDADPLLPADPRTAWHSIVVGVLIAPALVFARVQQERCRALGRMAPAYLLPSVGHPLVLVGGLLFVLYADALALTGGVAAAIFAVAHLPIGLVQRWWFWSSLSPSVPTASPVFETRTWLHVAGSLLLVAGFVTLLNQADLLVVGWLLGADAAGVYKAAATLSGPVGFVFAAVNAVVAPRFAALHAEGDRDGLRRLLAAAIHLSFWPTLVVGAGVVLGRSWLLGIFGDAFAAGSPALVLLVLAQIANAGTGAVGYLLNMTGHHRDSARIYGISALLCIGGNLACVPVFGVTGAAATTLATTLVWNVWLHARVRQRLNVAASIVHHV
jgi:O-antigen/teichoic acid export membrane protein